MPTPKICSECGKEKCLRNDGPFGGCYAEPSIQHQKEVCHGHTPKPESEQTNLERPYWFEADRMFQLFDEAIKNYWKIADETEDFLKGFGYRPPKAEPPELADTLAYFCRQAEQRGVKRGLGVAKEAVAKDEMGCMQEVCKMGGGLGDASKGSCYLCLRSAIRKEIQSEITKLNL
jgi:hypothetical protein